MDTHDTLTPLQFTQSAGELIDFLNKKFSSQKLYVSDIQDDLNRQCVDLVQEGGGVYGIALAGYTYILEKMGISFIKMAGTSAGSINTLLIASVYTRQEAEHLKLDPAPYYETRSEKVLEYLAEKDLSDIVDGHPVWKKIILNIFNNPTGMSELGRKFLFWGKYFMATVAALIMVCGLALYLTLRCCNSELLRWSTTATWLLLILILIFAVGLSSKFILSRFLYRHAERLGINPGNDFLNWIRKILQKNKVDDITALKEKISGEAKFNAGYRPPSMVRLASSEAHSTAVPNPREKIRYSSLEPILDLIQNNSISLDFIFDQLNEIYKPNDPASPAALDRDMHRIVEAFEQRTLNAVTQGIAGPGTVTRELVLVSSDLTNEIKVEFPGMHRMYWGDDFAISPANYVRASMSVPFFFKPFQVIYDPKQMNSIRDEWNKYTKVYKNLGKYALFVDGGMLSNFPINVFNDPTIPLPRKPTLGIKLEYDDRSTSDPINNLTAFGSRMISTMRFFYDRDFLIKNESYRKTVRSVDTGKISWLNFGLDNKQKIELFFRGALAAAIFLTGKAANPAEIKKLCDMGKTIPFAEDGAGTFSMYANEADCFQCAELDPLLGDISFDWATYKAERIRSLLVHPVQKQNLKNQASTKNIITHE